MKMSKFSNTGYSSGLAMKLLDNHPIHILIGEGATPQVEFKDGKPTGNINSVRVEFYIEGVGADRVKLPADFEIDPKIKDFDVIELVNVEAVEVNRNVYFRADDIKPAK